MFVAVGYAGVNKVRAAICDEAKGKGYTLITYVSSKATTWGDTQIGDNCFIFEDNTIQPFVTIGDDCVLWSGNHIGHHVTIGDHCFITSHVVISGHVSIGGLLASSASTRRSATRSASAKLTSSARARSSCGRRDDREVYVPQRTKPHERPSDEIRM